ncbi:MAG: thrombospondin type 3 repeat-containing protein [Patescibacteria group bacterium]
MNHIKSVSVVLPFLALVLVGAGCSDRPSAEVAANTTAGVETSVDADNDGLTTEQEATYGTDVSVSDTDHDGYSDGEEVTNGYNPLGDGSLATENGIVTTTTVNCGDENCFEAKFAACEPAKLVSDLGFVSFSYEIIGPVEGGCSMTVMYPTNPNPAWVNQPMTCTFDNTIDFTTSAQQTIEGSGSESTTCTGPLVAIFNE